MEKLTPEQRDALQAIANGDGYQKAHAGAQRAGRTRTLRTLRDKGMWQWSTDAANRELTTARASRC